MSRLSDLRAAMEPWCAKDDRIGWASYLGTFAAYFGTLALALFAPLPFWTVAVLVVINALSGVRLYVLQHDCGHYSLFSSRRLNEWAGYGLSTFTLTPFRTMQYNHNRHHAHIGDLDHRETGEIYTMTLPEWQAAGFWERLQYRLYRNPLIMLPLGGILTYAIRYRWPKNAVKVGAAEVMVQNLALALWIGAIGATAEWWGIGVYLATVVVAGTVGVFSVYLQHNFAETYWDRQPDYNVRDASLHGSSVVDLGWWYDCATGNISYHALHHFNPRIPSYRLRYCFRALRDPFGIPSLGWRGALNAFTLKLWDEQAQRLVPFPPQATTVPKGLGTPGPRALLAH
jgi:acyl-lipid omega-6 desaturase (Delta-12 desaturase)